jgi:hypothetical protein
MAVLTALTLVALALGPETVRLDIEEPARRENIGVAREALPTAPADSSPRS